MLISLTRPAARWNGIVLRAFDRVLDWQETRRQRRDLAALPDHLLRDIGVTRADVERELSKPFWRT